MKSINRRRNITRRITNEIAKLEASLEESRGIERLNADTVLPEERTQLGEKLRNLDQLRIRELNFDLAAIEQQVALLEQEQPSRLQTYGVLP